LFYVLSQCPVTRSYIRIQILPLAANFLSVWTAREIKKEKEKRGGRKGKVIFLLQQIRIVFFTDM
jgi:hypothetical protein